MRVFWSCTGAQRAPFTPVRDSQEIELGDTLFVGAVGRPDLPGDASNDSRRLRTSTEIHGMAPNERQGRDYA